LQEFCPVRTSFFRCSWPFPSQLSLVWYDLIDFRVW